MFETIKCQFGFHNWGIRRRFKKDSCETKVTCKKCSKERMSEKLHDTGKSRLELFVHHPCKKNIICLRCGEETKFKQSHSWSRWSYKNLNTCYKERRCRNCGEREEEISRYYHEWGDWESNRYYPKTRKCHRCGEEEQAYREEEQSYGQKHSSILATSSVDDDNECPGSNCVTVNYVYGEYCKTHDRRWGS